MGNKLKRGKGKWYHNNVESQYPFITIFVTKETLQKRKEKNSTWKIFRGKDIQIACVIWSILLGSEIRLVAGRGARGACAPPTFWGQRNKIHLEFCLFSWLISVMHPLFSAPRAVPVYNLLKIFLSSKDWVIKKWTVPKTVLEKKIHNFDAIKLIF